VPAIPFIATVLSTFRDLFLILFLALGSAWFALDILRRLRADTLPAKLPLAPAPAPLPTAPAPIITAPAPTVVHSPVTAAPQPVHEGIPPDHLAVIAATVHHLFRGRGRLSGVSRTLVSDHRWAHEGRRDIFSSHRIR